MSAKGRGADSLVYRKGPIELRCGDYREVLADVEPDAVITDPPYSERTVAGHRHGAAGHAGGPRRTIGYAGWDESQTRAFTDWTAAHAREFLVQWGDHIQFAWSESAARASGMFTFAPVPWIKVDGGTPRFTADGPSASVEWALVARASGWPRGRRYREGHYLGGSRRGGDGGISGGKPLWLMRALVRDYSEPGDLICDPCAGGATTLIAAALEGRRAIGAELDPETFAKACARIERTALTAPLPFMDTADTMKQEPLL